MRREIFAVTVVVAASTIVVTGLFWGFKWG